MQTNHANKNDKVLSITKSRIKVRNKKGKIYFHRDVVCFLPGLNLECDFEGFHGGTGENDDVLTFDVLTFRGETKTTDEALLVVAEVRRTCSKSVGKSFLTASIKAADRGETLSQSIFRIGSRFRA